MTLDDRSLREHLDRRAETGVTEVEQIAEIVMTRVATTDRGPLWRSLGVRVPSLGVAVAAIVVLVVAMAGLAPRFWPGPGSSPGDSAALASDYPAARAITADELDGLLTNPGDWTGLLLIADIELSPWDLACDVAPCPDLEIKLASNTVAVYGNGPTVGGPYAFRIRADGNFELVRAVKPGRDGLAWTLPQLTAALPDLRAADRSVPFLYLVDAWRAASTSAYLCPFTVGDGDSDFGCGTGVAWLVPDEASLPSDFNSAPTGSLRVPNVTGVRDRSDTLQPHGYWLVDPLVAQDEATCFLCPPAGAADLVGRVAGLDELVRAIPTPYQSFDASPTPAIATATVNGIAFSTRVVTLSGFEAADLTVTVTFADDVVPYHGADASLSPLLILQRDAGDAGDPLDPHIGQLVRTMRPSPVGGAWTATFRLTSGDQGFWRVDGLTAYDAESHELPVGPAIRDMSPTLEVKGASGPRMTMSLMPSVVEIGQALEVSGQVTDEDTGDPLGDVAVTIGIGDACAPGGAGVVVMTTPEGMYSHVIPEAGSSTVCAWIAGQPGVYPSPDSDVPNALYATLFSSPGGTLE